ncbi:MAG: DUF6144 family protein [Bacteroidota bacterium]|nr:DUF6144 family protein [Bacteroidota bacterium]
MKRSQFCNKLLTSGIACGCTLGLTGGSTLASALSGHSVQGAGQNETPCNEKMDFTQKWVKRFFEIVDHKLDKKTRTELMQANGEACAKGAYGEITTGNQPATIDEIDKTIAKWQQALGKENIYRADNIVYFNYAGNPKGLKISDGYCLCPMIENGPAQLSPTYCQCSVGYVRYMFEKLITFKPVRVELLESLRAGGKACRFRVMI